MPDNTLFIQFSLLILKFSFCLTSEKYQKAIILKAATKKFTMEYINFHTIFDDNIAYNTIKQIYGFKFKYLVTIFSGKKYVTIFEPSKGGTGIRFITARTTFMTIIIHKNVLPSDYV
jgi:hypothetical protein